MKLKYYNTIFKRLLPYIILCIMQVYHSQTTMVNPAVINNVSNIVSPEVNTLLRYQDFPDVGFIGGTDISIPIYEIKYDGLSIPISLSYNTKGVKVADIASSVGLGWTLNAGGSISVETNEKYDFSAYYQRQTQGGIVPTTTSIPAGSGIYGENYATPKNYIIDAAPDFYHVSAPGLNDKFYLSKINGQFKMESLQNFKTTFLENIKDPEGFDVYAVDLNYSREIHRVIKQFDIKNENGFLYNFQNKILLNKPSIMGFGILTASSWLLSSIQSPNKNVKVEFLYEPFTNNYIHSVLSIYQKINTGSVDISKIINSNPAPSDANQISNPELEAQIAGKGAINVTKFNNSQRIKTIVFPEGSVNFIYGDTRLDYDGEVLSKIIIKDLSGKEIKYLDFRYSYFQSTDSNCSGKYNCLRLKLDEVYDSSLKSNYAFSYGGMRPNDNLFPPRGSGKVDFLGYYKDNGSLIDIGCKSNCDKNDNLWNGVGSPTYNNVNLNDVVPTNKVYFYPNLTRDYFVPFKLSNYTEEAITGLYDGSATTQSLLGLLTSVRYPTKGGLKIEYENDDFEYLGVDYLLGSARIKSMEYFDTSNNSLRKINYFYKNSNQKSSGEICFLIPPTDILKAEVNTGYKNSAIVGYSKIVQEEMGNGRTEKYYSNFSSYPDIYENIDPSPSTTAQINFFKFFKYPGVFIQRMDLRRGKLLNEIVYNNQNDVVKKNSFEYLYYEKNSFDTTKNIFEHTGIMPHPTNVFYAKNKLINYQNYLSKQIVEDYFGGNIIKTESIYSYNQPNSLLTKQQTIMSDTNLEVSYMYPTDLNQTDMINANILSTPLIVENKLNGKTTDKKQITYSKNANTNNLVLPTSIQKFDIQNPSISQTEMTYDQYDSKGNLQQYTTKDGTPTVIIWGYNQSLPIAKIEGKDAPLFLTMLNTDITALSNASNSDIDLVTEEQFRTKLNAFQKRQFNLDVSITTYTHDPLIGVTSITPPSGIREVYIYDTSRLKEIRQDSNTGKLLKEFKYNYKN